MSKSQHENTVSHVRLFMCANCSTSISMNVDPERIIEIDGRKQLLRERCWCDEEHGILIYTSNL